MRKGKWRVIFIVNYLCTVCFYLYKKRKIEYINLYMSKLFLKGIIRYGKYWLFMG